VQTFYGTIPAVLVVVAAILQMHREAKSQTLLKDILTAPVASRANPATTRSGSARWKTHRWREVRGWR
jgi:hypothetical protein